MIEETVVYFHERGDANTGKVLELSKTLAANNKIQDIIVASTTGKTGVQACGVFPPT